MLTLGGGGVVTGLVVDGAEVYGKALPGREDHITSLV